MASLSEFESETFRLGGERSIQLSYKDISSIIIQYFIEKCDRILWQVMKK